MNPILAFVSPNSWRVFRRNMLAWQKYAAGSVAINIFEPFAYFIGLGFGLGAYLTLGGGQSLLQFLAPGILGLTIVNTATFDTAWGSFERLTFNNVYESMVTAPVDPLEIAAGEYLWQAFRATLYGTIFVLVIVGFGLVHSWWALLVPPVLALMGILFAIPALAVAMMVKTQEHLFYYFSLIVTPSVMIGGVFFPLDRLPHWLQTVAWWTPIYHSVNVLRALVTGNLSAATAFDALWIAVAIALLVWVPMGFLRRRLAN